jgi:hypothetical protein
MTFSLAASLNVPLGLRVNIDPLNLTLFNREVEPIQPYATVPLRHYSLKGVTNITITNQTTKVQDQDQFIIFLAKAVYSKTFVLSAKGSTIAHLGALKAPVTLDKDIELSGTCST